ncbi:MAG TPA: hypothetical protein VFD62_16860 [Pyrinomonadaceae bacterium]|nr:hypothetical protein [Pyrinomonadaceae bacterium]
MSWWDTGNKDDVIGDQPADLVRHALKEIAETRAQQAKDKPRLADVVQAIGTVALSSGGELLDQVPSDLREIVAELESGQTISSGHLRGTSETNDIVRVLTDNLGQIVAVYHERWERNPRFSEWLDTLSFVLRSRPERFLHDGLEHPPSQLTALASGDQTR